MPLSVPKESARSSPAGHFCPLSTRCPPAVHSLSLARFQSRPSPSLAYGPAGFPLLSVIRHACTCTYLHPLHLPLSASTLSYNQLPLLLLLHLHVLRPIFNSAIFELLTNLPLDHLHLVSWLFSSGLASTLRRVSKPSEPNQVMPKD